MSKLIDTLDLSDEMKETLERYLTGLQKTWRDELEGILLFGSVARGDFVADRSNINLLVMFRQISVSLLQSGKKLHQQWGKHHIIAPLMMTQNDMRQSCQLFPLEFLQMKDHHVLLLGQNPFDHLQIGEESLARQCEQELMSNLLRVRQRFVEGEGRQEAIQALLILSITSVIPCLRGILHVVGQSSQGTDKQILDRLPLGIQFDPNVMFEVLNMKRGTTSPGSLEWIKVYERYLENLGSLVEHIGNIRQTGPR